MNGGRIIHSLPRALVAVAIASCAHHARCAYDARINARRLDKMPTLIRNVVASSRHFFHGFDEHAMAICRLRLPAHHHDRLHPQSATANIAFRRSVNI